MEDPLDIRKVNVTRLKPYLKTLLPMHLEQSTQTVDETKVMNVNNDKYQDGGATHSPEETLIKSRSTDEGAAHHRSVLSHANRKRDSQVLDVGADDGPQVEIPRVNGALDVEVDRFPHMNSVDDNKIESTKVLAKTSSAAPVAKTSRLLNAEDNSRISLNRLSKSIALQKLFKKQTPQQSESILHPHSENQVQVATKNCQSDASAAAPTAIIDKKSVTNTEESDEQQATNTPTDQQSTVNSNNSPSIAVDTQTIGTQRVSSATVTDTAHQQFIAKTPKLGSISSPLSATSGHQVSEWTRIVPGTEPTLVAEPSEKQTSIWKKVRSKISALPTDRLTRSSKSLQQPAAATNVTAP